MKRLQDNSPFISIIIPCRNEEKFIGRCLDSIIAQDYPKDKLDPHPNPGDALQQVGRERGRGRNLEILVVDGMSEAERIKEG